MLKVWQRGGLRGPRHIENDVGIKNIVVFGQDEASSSCPFSDCAKTGSLPPLTVTLRHCLESLPDCIAKRKGLA